MISEQDAYELRHELTEYAMKQLRQTGKDFCIVDTEDMVKIGIYQYVNHIANGFGHEYSMTWAKRWMVSD